MEPRGHIHRGCGRLLGGLLARIVAGLGVMARLLGGLLARIVAGLG
ncbi:MAG: hypothetical protein QJR12_07405 [Mycobacterium sp.]|nr:hypothetical protein [Mycobacterium sp.]MDI3314100.1 hypothetical protein [Mycobacterium sp.]